MNQNDNKDDRLPNALANLAREQAKAPPPAGLLAKDTEAEATIRERAVRRALEALGVTGEAGENTRPVATPPVPTPKRSKAIGRWSLVLMPMAAVAAIAVFSVREPLGPALPRGTLPPYTLDVSGGVALTRGESPEDGPLLIVEQGSRVEVRLRPRDRFQGPVGARLFWSKRGRLKLWPTNAEVATGGAIRVVGLAPQPFGLGPGILIAVVAPPDLLPADEPAAFRAFAERDPRLQVIRWSVRWK